MTAALLLIAGVSGAPLSVTVTNVRSDKGHVLVAVCDKAQFLLPSCAYVGNAPSRAGAVTVRVEGVPPGVYAVQAYQDENDNRKIDRNFLGIPTEGIGFSRDARFHFGPPDFADAAVTVGPEGGEVTIRLRYY